MTDVAALAAEWVRELPDPFVHDLAAALRAGATQVKQLLVQTTAPMSHQAAGKALELARDGDGANLAGLLDGRRGAALESASIRPVWTGPTS